MPTLKIDLQEGFGGDHVVVQVDDSVVYDKKDVRTRMQLGLADSVQVETGTKARLTVRLPMKAIEGVTTVHVEKTPNIGVKVEGKEIRFDFPPEGQVMFGYV